MYNSLIEIAEKNKGMNCPQKTGGICNVYCNLNLVIYVLDYRHFWKNVKDVSLLIYMMV